MAMPQDFVDSLLTGPHGDISVFFEPEQTVIQLSGDVDLALAEGLDFVAQTVIERGRRIRVDASRVTFIDSTGLNMIAKLGAAERQAGRRLRVDGAGERLRELLLVSGLSPLVRTPIVDPVSRT